MLNKKNKEEKLKPRLSWNQGLGLLVLRVGIGAMFVGHGFPKIIGGVAVWEKLGAAMGILGINFFPPMWGFFAALAEFVGGLLLIFGFFTRPACLILAITMVVASTMHIAKGDPFKVYSHAVESLILFISLAFIGIGPLSIDRYLEKKRQREEELAAEAEEEEDNGEEPEEEEETEEESHNSGDLFE